MSTRETTKKKNWTADLIAANPNPLARYYTRFLVQDRVLLTGHSHQAWPDCGFEGQAEAWLDAAEHVDNKWRLAGEKADAVRHGYRSLLDDVDGQYSLSASTHDLLIRLLSAILVGPDDKILTTDKEFYSATRQFLRLREMGWKIEFVNADPVFDVGERLAAAIDKDTACVYTSTVFFHNAGIAGGIDHLAQACLSRDVPLIADAYHHLNVVPFSIRTLGLEQAFVLGGGYKYCQLGEGNAFLRYPAECRSRPVITGWFSDFASLSADPTKSIDYGGEGDRFAGATYDPTSHYRGARVFQFFQEQGLTVPLLREISQRQVARLASEFDALDLDPRVLARDQTVDLNQIAGFLSLQSPQAAQIQAALEQRGVATDSRKETLRLGPAPYVSNQQLDQAIRKLGEVVSGL